MKTHSQKDSTRIVFIGAGKLASCLAPACINAGHIGSQGYSRTEESARKLSGKLSCHYTTSLEEITDDADVYFFAVKDDAIEKILTLGKFKGKMLVHTAGSLDINIFDEYTSSFGVFYPLQTFSKKRTIHFREIPVFVEANNDKTEILLMEMANSISDKVFQIDSQKRMRLHISAVFACNIVNHMYAVAEDLLGEEKLPFSLLEALITETAAKATEYGPQQSQTGPAVRFDTEVIKKHLEILTYNKKYQEIYKFMSDSIHEQCKVNANKK